MRTIDPDGIASEYSQADYKHDSIRRMFLKDKTLTQVTLQFSDTSRVEYVPDIHEINVRPLFPLPPPTPD